jgi:penicillin-binding protein 1C
MVEVFPKKNVFDEDEIIDAYHEPLDAYRRLSPKIAPHLAFRLKQENPEKLKIETNINRENQQKIQNLTYNYIQQYKAMNITNAAVLVVDNETMEVTTYVGSADFWDDNTQGMVDGVQAVRSPGSALKPVLYTLAFDKGIITPKYKITDVPINFSGYRPDNYDGIYRGKVSIEKALALSLNVPAVKVLDMYGTDEFVEKLSKIGFSSIKSNKNNLGLSVILGGCGVKLEEMVALFSCFAHEGILEKLRFVKDTSTLENDTRIFSKAASYMTTEILTSLVRPDLPNKFESTMNLPRVAWKTGTSYGRRDAWAIGYNKHYTIGVWIGNFPGIGVPEMNGAEYAVPLLFQIFNTIDYNTTRDWYLPPDEMDYRMICSETGLKPNSFCEDKVQDKYIPGVSHHSKCQHLREVYVDKDEKYSYCRSCKPQLGYKTKTYPNYPADLIAFYEEQAIPYTKIPAHNPDCKRVFYENGPRIVSLTNDMEYILFKGESTKLMLRCQAENDVQSVYWYVNDKFIGKKDKEEKLFFEPKEGEIKISCSDDKGRNTDVYIKVRFI